MHQKPEKNLSAEKVFDKVIRSNEKHLRELFYLLPTGADLGFSRGGGGGRFQKKLENFDDLFFFFRSTKLIFRALPKHCCAPISAKFLRRRQIFEKTVKKAVFGHFLKNFDKKSRFFWRALPLKVSIYWRRRRL